jgi:arginine decarboxylase (EC 4.1.1.19)
MNKSTQRFLRGNPSCDEGQEMAGKGGRGVRSRSEMKGLHLKGCDVQFIRKLCSAPVTRKKLDRLSPAGTQKMLRHDVEHIVGKHVYGNLYGCDAEALADEQLIVRVVNEAVKVAKATLMEVKSWKVEGVKGGVSVLALITESHIAVHTLARVQVRGCRRLHLRGPQRPEGGLRAHREGPQAEVGRPALRRQVVLDDFQLGAERGIIRGLSWSMT